MNEERKVVEFPGAEKPELTAEETEHRRMTEVKRLAGLPDSFRLHQIRHAGRAELVGLQPKELEDLVAAEVKDREKQAKQQKREDRQREQRAERMRGREEKKAERQHKAAQTALDKEAKAKAAARAKALQEIAKLPVALRDAKLVELAAKLGCGPCELRDELEDLIGGGDVHSSEPPLWHVEPWGEPVTAAKLLPALISKYTAHVSVEPHEALVINLWVLFAWVHGIAKHSPLLVFTSAEPASGKSLALEVLSYLTPRPRQSVEITGPALYRFVDANKPTLLLDEVDSLFKRKPDFASLMKDSWSHTATVQRTVVVNGVYQTQFFSTFCPKAVAGLNPDMDLAQASRTITIRMWPRPPGSKVSFKHSDDEEFAKLRQQALRWATDASADLQKRDPLLPPGFDDRQALNWKIPLAIAELAGGDWPDKARRAAEHLTKTHNEPSLGIQLLKVCYQLCAKAVKAKMGYFPTKALLTTLHADSSGPWLAYRGDKRVGPITEQQIAHLLKPFEIRSSSNGTQRIKGYRCADFAKNFERFRIGKPLGRSGKGKGK
jgi:putative DNA primase/helicase